MLRVRFLPALLLLRQGMPSGRPGVNSKIEAGRRVSIVVAQILLACPSLEELMLYCCTVRKPRVRWRDESTSTGDLHPFLSAVAELLNAAPRSAMQARGLRSLQLHFGAHARVERNVLCDLATVPSIVIYADRVTLWVPGQHATLPAAVRIVTQSLMLTGSQSVEQLQSNLASFRSRCQLVVEGACLDTALANSAPPLSHHERRVAAHPARYYKMTRSGLRFGSRGY